MILCDKFDREKVKLYSKNISIKTESKYIKESLGVIEMLKNNIDGIILISSDMCIFDNMLDEYIKRKYNIKYINLIIKNEFVNLEENLEVFYT